MLRQACVSTFKFAGLAFLGMNVRPKAASTASDGDLGTKIEEGVAAATAATVPLMDPSAQPSPAPPVGSPNTSGCPDPSGDVPINRQGDNPKPQKPNPNGDDCGCAKPEEGATAAAGPSVDPQEPPPLHAGGGSSGYVSTTKPDCKAPLVYVNCKCKKCWCTKCKCTKDAVLCCAKACGTKACGTKACGTKATNQAGAGGPFQDASAFVGGNLGTKIVEGFAAAATVPLVDLIVQPPNAGGPDSSGGMGTTLEGGNPKPSQMANPIGGSANLETAPGQLVNPLTPPPPAGVGSSGPVPTNPMDNQDKCNMCAVFYSAYRAGATKATNQAGGDDGPSQDDTAGGNGGDKKDRREESIPPQDGASRVEPQVEPPPVQTTLWNDLSNVGIPGEALGFIAGLCWMVTQW